MENKLRWVYLFGFFLILALPLLNLPPWFSPPDWGKTIVFRIILAVLIFIFLWQIFSQKQFQIKTSLPLWLLVSLLGIFFLATIFSLDANFSFFGSPYRSGGFLNFAFYIVFAVLAFLILKKSDWQKIWDFAILIGIFVSIIAIFQQFGILSKVFIPFSGRPPSTVGGPIFLAIYLLLLSFLTLSFGIKERNLAKKFFYLISLFLFVFVAVFITLTRAAFIGLAVGFLWFLFFYPKKLVLLKISALILLILGICGLYFLKIHPEVYTNQAPFVTRTIDRIISISWGLKAGESRISAWKVSLEALKTKPILGFGPENFSVGFDKYYEPSLPGIEKMPGIVHSWWDRAHNFVFDISLTGGILALIIYLSLFGVLFWQLQRLKSFLSTNNESVTNLRISPAIPHALQATFIAYLVANFFSFDTFSTYLISFLLIAYSLHLLSSQATNETPENNRGFRLIRRIYADSVKWKMPILIFLLVILVWFIWGFNIKPLQINSQINLAIYQMQNNDCQGAVSRMEEILPRHSFLDNYLRLKYIEIINQCIKQAGPEDAYLLVKKATEILKENVKIRPHYTRNWLLLGQYTNILIESGEKNLKEETNSYFEKANQLSPKRQEVFTEWIKTDLLTEEYQKAKEKSEKCIELNEKLTDCYWLMGLSQAYLKDLDMSDYYILTAREKGYPVQSKESLLQLTKVYIETENYPGLVKIYSDLISLEPNNPQHHASLAFVYKELGDLIMAKKEALRVLELQPENKEAVEEFLEGLE